MGKDISWRWPGEPRAWLAGLPAHQALIGTMVSYAGTKMMTSLHQQIYTVAFEHPVFAKFIGLVNNFARFMRHWNIKCVHCTHTVPPSF